MAAAGDGRRQGSATTYLLSAIAFRFAAAGRVPLGETTLVQLAASFANRLAPGSVGGAALHTRYLRQKGLPTPEAATVVAASRVAGFISVALLLPVLLAGARGPSRTLVEAAIRQGLPILLAAAAVLAAAGLVLAVPRLRRRGRVAAGQIVGALRVITGRRLLAWLIVTSLALTLNGDPRPGVRRDSGGQSRADCSRSTMR